jgi:S-formylglutathione hydrolase FrmB
MRQAAGDMRFERWFAPRFGRDTVGWYAREPARLAERLVRAGTPVPALYLDCGLGDVYLDQNRAFAATLRQLGLSYRYHEPRGGHEWDYWRSRLPESLSWLLSQVTRAALDGPGGGAAGRGA